ncbi:hypothetical protein BTM25_10750 [Actinomadura rubteroloni]|uniref:Secreted protein n=1 Tax=Actinomadura rubteroloni TaxID=1926885 RepID=A0A2P4UNP4_9ACTN|nr:hypothetical protein [Actinomadura rubteroloni]POM26671.1 hypothetical protein BTM25_10750 [Actinomadura rubteroloni]
MAVASACALLGTANAFADTQPSMPPVDPPLPRQVDPLTQTYRCVMPWIGEQPISVTFTTKAPTVVGTDGLDVSASVDLGVRVRNVLELENATVSGRLDLGTRLALPGGEVHDYSVAIPLQPYTGPIPSSGKPDLTGTGKWKPPAGKSTFNVDLRTTGIDLSLDVHSKDGGGEPTVAPMSGSSCTLQPPDQNTLLAEMWLRTSAPIVTTKVAGTAHLKRPSADVPLSGTFTSTGALTLDEKTAAFSILGFLPATARLRFVQNGAATGDTVARTAFRVPLNLIVADLSVFGVSVGGGSSCRTTAPADVPFTRSGDAHHGAFTLPALGGCGVLTPLLSALFTGDGNTVDATFTS